MIRITLLTIFCGLFVIQGLGQRQQNQFNQVPQRQQQQLIPPQTQARQVGGASCPEKNGRFPVNGQCDAYIECVEGVGEEKLCPDGLLFNDKATLFAFPCQYPIDVSCENRAKLQSPQATDDCPHQFGYFRLGDSKACGQFMNCVDGRGFVFDCPEGLAFNKDTYRCDWADQVPDCDAEAYLGFTCPPEARVEGFGFAEQRYYRNAIDCQRYYLCIEGRPRMYSCGEGNAFNDLTNACDAFENVTTCASSPSYRGVQPVQLTSQRG